MVGIRQFRTLVVVAETGGIRAAASRLGRTPSAVSVTLKQIEDEFGLPLFEGQRKVDLTPFGRFILDEVRSLIEHGERVNRSVRAFAKNGSGSVDVAILPSIATAFLPEALRSFARTERDVAVQIRDLDSRAIHEAVSREVVDWGVATYQPGAALEAEPLFSEPLRVVCANDHPLCRHDGPLPWEALAQHVFIGNGAYGPLSPGFLAAVPAPRMHVRNVVSLLATVQAGVGITILPSLSQINCGSSLRFLPIADEAARRTVHLLRRGDRRFSPMAERFAALLRSLVRTHAKTLDLKVYDER